MLLWLFQQLGQDIRAFNVFNYLTLRAVLAALTALTISFIVGPAVIRKLAALKIGQSVRNDGPQTHLIKAGTPTMGGALILVSVTITTLLWADLRNDYVWVALFTLLGFGVIGWVDDWRKVVEKNSRGLPSRWKYFWQSVIGLLVAGYLWQTAALPAQTELIIPFLKHATLTLVGRGVHRADLFRHRGLEQCSQPDRWPGWPGHPADRDGGGGPGDFCLRCG